MRATDIEPLASALADRYSIGALLGIGGMATVHPARDLRQNRDVALKMLRSGLGDSTGRERVIREIRLAASRAYPRILPLYDLGDTGSALW